MSHDEYLLSLDSEEGKAYLTVDLFIIAVGECIYKQGLVPHMTYPILHRIFPNFGREMGVAERLLETHNGKCVAVSLLLRDQPGDVNEDVIQFILPVIAHAKRPEKIESHPEREKIRAAALAA